MIPRLKYTYGSMNRAEGRETGSGGGGRAGNFAATTPYFCKKCGRTVARTSVLENCDVCKKCRVRK